MAEKSNRIFAANNNTLKLTKLHEEKFESIDSEEIKNTWNYFFSENGNKFKKTDSGQYKNEMYCYSKIIDTTTNPPQKKNIYFRSYNFFNNKMKIFEQRNLLWKNRNKLKISPQWGNEGKWNVFINSRKSLYKNKHQEIYELNKIFSNDKLENAIKLIWIMNSNRLNYKFIGQDNNKTPKIDIYEINLIQTEYDEKSFSEELADKFEIKRFEKNTFKKDIIHSTEAFMNDGEFLTTKDFWSYVYTNVMKNSDSLSETKYWTEQNKEFLKEMSFCSRINKHHNPKNMLI